MYNGLTLNICKFWLLGCLHNTIWYKKTYFIPRLAEQFTFFQKGAAYY